MVKIHEKINLDYGLIVKKKYLKIHLCLQCLNLSIQSIFSRQPKPASVYFNKRIFLHTFTALSYSPQDTHINGLQWSSNDLLCEPPCDLVAVFVCLEDVRYRDGLWIPLQTSPWVLWTVTVSMSKTARAIWSEETYTQKDILLWFLQQIETFLQSLAEWQIWVLLRQILKNIYICAIRLHLGLAYFIGLYQKNCSSIYLCKTIIKQNIFCIYNHMWCCKYIIFTQYHVYKNNFHIWIQEGLGWGKSGKEQEEFSIFNNW